MAAISNIVINDGAATPVAHTFGPAFNDGVLSKWNDRSGGVVAGFAELSLGAKLPQNGSQVQRYTAKVSVPILEQTSPSTATGIQPAPTVGYTMLATVDIVLPVRATQQNRKDLLAFLKNYLATTVITSAVVDLEPVL